MYSEIHVNISNILLFTQVIVDKIICSENLWVKLKKNARLLDPNALIHYS